MSLDKTPRGERIHIGIFGRRNSGKSSLINAVTGQDIALVSDAPGTTTDPVLKAMELPPAGPVVFMDTAGFDDEGELGSLRVRRTEDILQRTDIGIIVIEGSRMKKGGSELSCEIKWLDMMKSRDIPVIIAVSKWDGGDDADGMEAAKSNSKEAFGSLPAVFTSAFGKTGLEELREAVAGVADDMEEGEGLLGSMVKEGSLVLLVMPQDIQAPKGRLILPQAQTLRELLDKRAVAVSTGAENFGNALSSLCREPDLIITDSQCFDTVWQSKPEGVPLTSFSILFAAYKGDAPILAKGALALDDMTEKSRILIAEACTHPPLSEDVGTVKIPALLRERLGENIKIVHVRGGDFPKDEELSGFDMVIHCGACMFNRKHVMNRIYAAARAGVPITNYGMILAKISGILDRVEIPGL